MLKTRKLIKKIPKTDSFGGLEDLRIRIKQICNNLSIQYGLINELPDNSSLVHSQGNSAICLYKTINDVNRCIAGIGFETYDYDGKQYLEINSITQESERQKGYNKFLRCILIMFATEIMGRKIDYIASMPMNYLSAYSLMNYFSYKLNDDIEHEFLDFKDKYKHKVDLFNMLRQAYEQNKGVQYIMIPLSVNNRIKAKTIVDTILDHELLFCD